MSSARELISTLGATFATVSGFVMAQLTVFAPPDPDAMLFLQAASAIAGVLLGGALWFWRRHRSFKPAYVFVAAALAGIAGMAGLFVYEQERSLRTEFVTLAGQAETFIVADVLTEDGRAIARANSINECNDLTQTRVDWACASAIVHVAPEAYVLIFNSGDIDASRRILALWYRIAAFGMMLAIYGVISQILFEITGSSARKDPPTT